MYTLFKSVIQLIEIDIKIKLKRNNYELRNSQFVIVKEFKVYHL